MSKGNYVFAVCFGNPARQELGVLRFTFPIIRDRYAKELWRMSWLGVKDPFKQGGWIDSVESDYSVLKALAGSRARLDEMDCLARGLAEMSPYERLRFQAAAASLPQMTAGELLKLLPKEIGTNE